MDIDMDLGSDDDMAMDLDPPSPPRPSRSTPANPWDVNDFITHLHAACLHPVDHSFNDFDHQGFQSAPGNYGDQVVIFIQHPRWCSACLDSRTDAIKKLGFKRLAMLARLGLPTKKHEKEVAYIAGLFKGRMAAVSARLEDSENLGTKSGRANTVANILSLFDNLNLDNPADQEQDQLSEMLAAFDLKDDDEESERELGDDLERELERELKRAYMLAKKEEKGYADGRGVQARSERKAMEIVNPQKREEGMLRALL